MTRWTWHMFRDTIHDPYIGTYTKVTWLQYHPILPHLSVIRRTCFFSKVIVTLFLVLFIPHRDYVRLPSPFWRYSFTINLTRDFLLTLIDPFLPSLLTFFLLSYALPGLCPLVFGVDSVIFRSYRPHPLQTLLGLFWLPPVLCVPEGQN